MTDKERNKKIRELNDKLHQNQFAHEKRQNRIHNALVKLMCECPHTKTKRYSDPSGGSDHAYECLICGKEW